MIKFARNKSKIVQIAFHMTKIWSKTILAWWAAQIQSHIRLHVGLATLDPIPRSRLGSNLARLHSARLNSARCWWCGRWVPLCWRVSWLGTDMACQLCMLTSQLSGSVTWVGSTGIRVRSAYPGEEDEWGASGRVDSHLVSACRRVWPCSMSDFDVIFTSVLVFSSSTQWYGQNTILTIFISGQKSNTTLNHMLWYQLNWCFYFCSVYICSLPRCL
jgi:hypothetical protein